MLQQIEEPKLPAGKNSSSKVNCADPFLTAHQRLTCMVKQKPYYIQFDKMTRELSHPGGLQSKAVTLAADSGPAWLAQVEGLLLTPTMSDFLTTFLDAWKKMFLTHHHYVVRINMLCTGTRNS